MTFITLVGVATVAGYFVLYPQTLFKPGARMFDTGYDLGLAGGIMMLLLLLYPVRKRVKLFRNLGPLSVWFRWHMVLGILGPLTIIFHSTYHVYIPVLHPIGSPNAAVAMACMLVVSASGTFGRFFYTKIHHGLYGRMATVKDLQSELSQAGEIHAIFSYAPRVQKALDDFRAHTESYTRRRKVGFVNFFAVGLKAGHLARSLSREVRRVIRAQAAERKLSAAQRAAMEQQIRGHQKVIAAYLGAVRDAAQFGTYERLFSWWHILHVPMVYIMVYSAFYHVYAVHAF